MGPTDDLYSGAKGSALGSLRLMSSMKGTRSLLAYAYCNTPVQILLKLFRQMSCFACSRARPREGRRIEMRMVIMEVTTNNSIKVKACRIRFIGFMGVTPCMP